MKEEEKKSTHSRRLTSISPARAVYNDNHESVNNQFNKSMKSVAFQDLRDLNYSKGDDLAQEEPMSMRNIEYNQMNGFVDELKLRLDNHPTSSLVEDSNRMAPIELSLTP